MSPPKLSRRMLLRGAGVVVGLPLLDAMVPRVAFGQSVTPSRFVLTYMGTCTGGASLTNPAAAGPLTVLPRSFAALGAVKQHVTLISRLAMPIHASGASPTSPGSALNIQHGGTMSPIVSGTSAVDGVAPLVRGSSADQLAADFLGAGSKYASMQMRVQAAAYNNTTGSSAQRRGVSTRKSGNTLSELLPIESPARIFSMLFSGTTPMPGPVDAGTPAGDAGVVTSLLERRRSVLDFVLDDANRLSAAVGADDRQKLDQHFTHLRTLERSLVASDGGMPMTGAGGGGGSNGGGSCSSLQNPGPDPTISTFGFGGWSNETLRGRTMADLITYALACDLTRSVSWMLTHDQCWLNSTQTSGSTIVSPDGSSDVHNDSHFAPGEIKADNANWGAGLFARLVQNLSERSEAGGTVLDHTFLSMVFAEGLSAHMKSDLTSVVAGVPSKIRNGVHVISNGAHPAQVQIAGLQAVGMNVSTLGEVSGVVPGLRI